MIAQAIKIEKPSFGLAQWCGSRQGKKNELRHAPPTAAPLGAHRKYARQGGLEPTDPRLRRPVLYPTELLPHCGKWYW